MSRDEIKATKIKAQRDIRWHLRALRKLIAALEALLDSLTDAATAAQLADELEDAEDAS